MAVNKETRISFATDDDLESDLKRLADAAGMKLSPYCEMVLRAHVAVQTSKRSLPLATQTYHLHKLMEQAVADGILTPIEREMITDKIADLLPEVRSRKVVIPLTKLKTARPNIRRREGIRIPVRA